MGKPKIIFHTEAETLEVLFYPGLPIDNSEMHGSYTLHYSGTRLAAIEINDADVIEVADDGLETTIGEMGHDEIQEESPFVQPSWGDPYAGNEFDLQTNRSIADDAIRGDGPR